MRDTEAVASIVAGAPDGLAAAYDRYADPLFRYCRTMLGTRAAAADAVQDTFVIAAARLQQLRAPEELRSWLFAVARGECRHRLPAGNGRPASGHTTADEAPDVTDDPGHPDDSDETQPDDSGRAAERAELRPLFEDAAAGLEPAEHEVVELQLRQGLTGAEVAAVLSVSRSHAHALLSRAAEQLEACLGVLLVSRTGRAECAELDAMLAGWDGQLTIPLRRRVHRHMEHCPTCSAKRAVELRPAMLLDLTPGAALTAGAAESFRLATAAPPELKAHTMALAAGDGPSAAAHSAAVLGRAGAFGRRGFPRPSGTGRASLGVLPRVETGTTGKGTWGTGAGGKNARGHRAGPGPAAALRSAPHRQVAVAAAVVAAVVIAATAFALTGGSTPFTPLAEAKAAPSSASAAPTPSAGPSGPAPRTSQAQPALTKPKPKPKQAASTVATNTGAAPTEGAPPTQAVVTPPSPTPPASTAPASPPGSPKPTARATPSPTASQPPAGGPTASPSPSLSPSSPPGELTVFPGGGTLVVFPGGGSPVFLHAFGGPVNWSVSVSNDPGDAVSVSPGSGTLTEANPRATVTVSVSQRLRCGHRRHRDTPCPTITIWPSGTVLTVQTGIGFGFGASSLSVATGPAQAGKAPSREPSLRAP